MTVYDFIKSLEYGKVYTIPSNVTWHDLKYDAAMRHGMILSQVTVSQFVRICPCCNR